MTYKVRTMITQRDIRGFKVRYHRNGSSGEGFHVCRFIYLRGAKAVDLQAVVFSASEPSQGRIAVTSADLADRWDGPQFENALLAAIAAVELAQPESIYS